LRNVGETRARQAIGDKAKKNSRYEKKFFVLGIRSKSENGSFGEELLFPHQEDRFPKLRVEYAWGEAFVSELPIGQLSRPVSSDAEI
jgi:hypothetical protein